MGSGTNVQSIDFDGDYIRHDTVLVSCEPRAASASGGYDVDFADCAPACSEEGPYDASGAASSGEGPTGGDQLGIDFSWVSC